MTYCDAFAGRLRNSRFDWSDESQELKASDIEFLTESFLDSNTFSSVCKRIEEKAVPSRQLDWGSWVIPATKAEIMAYMMPWKPGWDLPEPGDETHKPRLQRARCMSAVAALPPNDIYVLVVEEF